MRTPTSQQGALALLLLACSQTASASYASPPVRRQQTTAAPSTASPAPTPTAISSCHSHGSTIFCMFGTTEYQILEPATATTNPPPAYTDCHSHGADMFCVDPKGNDVEVALEGPGHSDEGHAEEGGHDHEGEGGKNCHFHAGVEHCTGDDSHEGEASAESSGETHCHFHAGVEHCTGGGAESASATRTCSSRDRDYNIPLRIGLIFVILTTSFIGVSVPIFIAPVLPSKLNVIFTILKQFGTGVIISTAMVHLYTHASLMFGNECLGELQYEATTSAIVMAGLLLSWLVDYVSHRLAKRYAATKSANTSHYNDDMVNVLILEAGIIFHSILVGVTLVVAGDSFFITLFVVILFHQMFEGLALGTRIATLRQHPRVESAAPLPSVEPKGSVSAQTSGNLSATESQEVLDKSTPLSMLNKLLMALAFAITTPIGMAIGTGVLKQFNGSDPSTIIAIGTLDALSAGILLWVGLVEMWARDWIFGGELVDAPAIVTLCASVGLIAGMVLMSFLGKWA